MRRLVQTWRKVSDIYVYAMPQLYGGQIATGELAQLTVKLGDPVSTRSPMKIVCWKLPKTGSRPHDLASSIFSLGSAVVVKAIGLKRIIRSFVGYSTPRA
jgi:hypothetical protein